MSEKSKILNKITAFWNNLTGLPSEFALEHRIAHSIYLIAMVSLSFSIPFNLFIGLYISSLITFIVCAVFAYLFYMSRYRGKMHNKVIWCGVLGFLLLIVNFFYNSGISGPTDLLMSLAALLIIAITPGKQHMAWLFFNIATVVALHIIGYYYPLYITDNYQGESQHFVDVTWTYFIVVIVMYFIIKYIRTNYDYERRKVVEKVDAIEQQNQYILVQNQELEHLNSEKNKLMSIIAHDLRAPLSNIQNYLELVTAYGLDQEEREIVEADLLNVTQNTLNMLSKLLVWSKAQMDGVTVKLCDMNLLETLRNTVELERMLAIKKDITLSYDIDSSITVIADTDMLQLVIRNLISNAIKFTPTGGSVDVKAEIQRHECKLSITDNGRGISYEQQADIFSLKARSTFGTNNEKGVGLGLLLCKDFVEQQGGRIGFQSTPGHGSTFFVFMPMG